VTSIDRSYQLIHKPLITEKATTDVEGRNAYHFKVPRDANKVEIRHAIEKLFDVKVTGVNTLRVKGKWRRRGYSLGRTQEWKKAMVTLEQGQQIEIL